MGGGLYLGVGMVWLKCLLDSRASFVRFFSFFLFWAVSGRGSCLVSCVAMKMKMNRY